ncbi:hypothetical protein DFH08DRAFT_1022839 [Mycena albidolilacea]|uniref:Uncharacterized protein n=1 Tax=Mycena albidolilacea TaxID=1033008 RepID=A0AAD7EKR1_9AGAR|nr:hypothetical protein DFH08DRAFT_1022839 [Mycena albidolilacea]
MKIMSSFPSLAPSFLAGSFLCAASDPHLGPGSQGLDTNIRKNKKMDVCEATTDGETSEMTASQKKRDAAAIHYRKNAEVIREKRRIQMAEKRITDKWLYSSAAIKARRRKSDKPRNKSAKKILTRASTFSEDTSAGTAKNLNMLTDAEREASETLTSMRQAGAKVVIQELPFHKSSRQVFLSQLGRDSLPLDMMIIHSHRRRNRNTNWGRDTLTADQHSSPPPDTTVCNAVTVTLGNIEFESRPTATAAELS